MVAVVNALRRSFRVVPALVLLFGAGAEGRAQVPEEEFIRAELRTFGWHVERRFRLEGTDRPLEVLRMQFTGPYSYFGPPVLRLQPLAQGTLGEGPDFPLPGNPGAEREGDAAAPPPSAPPVFLDLRPFGENPGRLLLLFLPGSEQTPFRIAVFDDSPTLTDRSSVHFYNLSSNALAVRVFDTTSDLPPREQYVWQVENGRRSSPVLVGVRDPDARVVYSSRFRLREGERLVLMARDAKVRGPGDSPVRIASFLEKVGERAPPPEAPLEPGLSED